MEEIFKFIPDYEGYYLISNFGKVLSYPRWDKFSRQTGGIIMKQHIDNAGYKFVVLYKDGASSIKKIHRLVAETFIPNIKCLPCVDHIDGDRLNNGVWNLRWCTYKENSNFELAKKRHSEQKDKYTHIGINNKFSRKVGKYTLDDQLIEIFESISLASKAIGINEGQIQRVCAGVRKTAGGFKWKYESEAIIKMPKPMYVPQNKKAVLQIDSNNAIVAEYDSISAAAKAVNGNAPNIGKVLKGDYLTYKGFKWKLK